MIAFPYAFKLSCVHYPAEIMPKASEGGTVLCQVQKMRIRGQGK